MPDDDDPRALLERALRAGVHGTLRLSSLPVMRVSPVASVQVPQNCTSQPRRRGAHHWVWSRTGGEAPRFGVTRR